MKLLVRPVDLKPAQVLIHVCGRLLDACNNVADGSVSLQ
jgi:hypothetical protein